MLSSHAKSTLGFMLFLFLFTIGINVYIRGPWPWSLIGSIMVGCWVGWVYERRDSSRVAPSVREELKIYCPRCKASRVCTGTGFRIDGSSFSPEKAQHQKTDGGPTEELGVVESNFHMYTCGTCGRMIWVQLIVVSNPISITVGSPPVKEEQK